MFWLLVTILGHFFNALAFVVDKFLLVKKIKEPTVYAFMVGMLGLAAFVLLPFDFAWPRGIEIVLDFFAGAAFVVALFFFFSALKRSEASRVVPFTGGLIPIITFVLAYFLLTERLSVREIIAFFLLVIGAVLIAYEKKKGKSERGTYFFAFWASVFFAASFVLMKMVFENQDFIPGFVWSRAGAGITAVFLLFYSPTRRGLFSGEERPKGKTGLLFLGGQISGAAGFILLNYAISLAKVSLVNAFQGLQYAFLFLILLILSVRWPKIIKESLERSIIIKKVAAILLIGAGLVLIAL